MIAELSAMSAFQINKETYYENKAILGQNFKAVVSDKALETIEQGEENNKDKMPILKFEIIKYLQKVDEFSDIPGEILKYLTDHITPLHFQTNEEIEKIDNLDISNYHYIIYSGTISLFINDRFVKTFKENTLISTLDLLIDYNATITLIANSDTKLYKIHPSEFTDNLNIYDEIPISIVKNTAASKTKPYNEVLKHDRLFKKIHVADKKPV
jgi:signal-transduction protein with cAMP-binding, CBS, and nucleotidyltransferase domain